MRAITFLTLFLIIGCSDSEREIAETKNHNQKKSTQENEGNNSSEKNAGQSRNNNNLVLQKSLPIPESSFCGFSRSFSFNLRFHMFLLEGANVSFEERVGKLSLANYLEFEKELHDTISCESMVDMKTELEDQMFFWSGAKKNPFIVGMLYMPDSIINSTCDLSDEDLTFIETSFLSFAERNGVNIVVGMSKNSTIDREAVLAGTGCNDGDFPRLGKKISEKGQALSFIFRH